VSVGEEEPEIEIVEAYVAPPPAPEPVLPTTASPLPLIGLAGGLFVALGGLIAGIRRRRG
jgi:LPXTG-motif cell wall-anchored protein